MTDVIRHRGPDDEGYLILSENGEIACYGNDTPSAVLETKLPWQPVSHINNIKGMAKLALGHRRLSIVDTSPLAHQPMSYANGRFWISYNGEIYNHIELREELRELGHEFTSQSDTEVILAAYAQWGTACLEHFNGMWAIAILDRHAHTLFVARDRFGVKPVYYHADNHGLITIVSEIKQLTVLPAWKARLNRQRTYDFLVWGRKDHTDETLFDRVFQLPAGHFALLSLDYPQNHVDIYGRLQTQAWYYLTPTTYEGSFEEASNRFRELLTESVRLRLRADVPVGSCLSGGLDSSAIVCLMRKLLEKQGNSRQITFSAYSDAPEIDESSWIDIVVKHTGVTGYSVVPEQDSLFKTLPALTWHQDEPFGSTSIYAQWCVFGLAAKTGIKVMLDGQGADEQLAGYHSSMAPLLAGLLRQGRLCEMIREITALHQHLGHSPLHITQRITDMLAPEALRQFLRGLAGKSSANRTPWLDLQRLGGGNVIDQTFGSTEQTRSIREQSFSMIRSSLPMLLHWEDRNSMAHSLESRVPFLDHRLVEFNISLPDAFKLHRGWTKRVMRSAMSGILPEPIRQRTDKIGFATAEEVWMRARKPEYFQKAMQNAVDQSDGLLTQQALTLLDNTISGKQAFSFLPWRLISMGAWMECFHVSST